VFSYSWRSLATEPISKHKAKAPAPWLAAVARREDPPCASSCSFVRACVWLLIWRGRDRPVWGLAQAFCSRFFIGVARPSAGFWRRVGSSQNWQDSHLFPPPRRPWELNSYRAFTTASPLARTAPPPVLRPALGFEGPRQNSLERHRRHRRGRDPFGSAQGRLFDYAVVHCVDESFAQDDRAPRRLKPRSAWALGGRAEGVPFPDLFGFRNKKCDSLRAPACDAIR
jgi:hypothetical protein